MAGIFAGFSRYHVPMADEKRDAEIGRIYRQYNDSKDTLACLKKEASGYAAALSQIASGLMDIFNDDSGSKVRRLLTDIPVMPNKDLLNHLVDQIQRAFLVKEGISAQAKKAGINLSE